ncbi:MAG: septum formation protein Maf [Bacteroidetes bacterium]|nr:septum formation protein Maf [Bacteroidota bacterium]HET6245047.1 Maf family nucleotide pyrophosphatase [Bacteroidia bacterium]
MKKYPHKLILGSKSPRRQSLLKELGFEFETHEVEVDESFPETLKREEIPMYLAGKKCEDYGNVADDSILITSDTIVWLNGEAINKPEGRQDAISMLKKLSGRMHEVITAICLRSSTNTKSFFVVTDVHFKRLTEEEIIYYVDNYKPFDKAGAYAIQEWIGYIGIEKINGSFYNVMGLPMKELYEALWLFSEEKVEIS